MRPICKQGYHSKATPDVPGNSLAAFKLAWKAHPDVEIRP